MATENFAFPIPNDVLEPYIKAAVSSAITSALGDGVELVRKAVDAALMQKVDLNGEVSKYYPDNKFNFVEIVAREKIMAIAREAINEMAEGMRPTIQAFVRAHIENKQDEISKALVDGLIGSLETSWNIKVAIQAHEDQY